MTSSSAQRLAGGLITAASVAYSVTALSYFAGNPMSGLVASVATLGVVLLHYVNMRAGLRGERPPLFPLTLALQAVATYLPDYLLPYGYSSVAAPMLAGTVLVFLPPRWGGPVVALMALYEAVSIMAVTPLVVTLFYTLTVLITGAMIYALVRFARVTVELEQARAGLAEAAVLKERLRISRDLHDGLGRSLTAIALKGDLASRLMDRDPDAAGGEVRELVKVAREAAQDVRQVARGYRELSLAGEVDRAVALLESSGVSCQANLTDTPLARRSDEALAWAVREAVTNVLRHSRATTCTITTSARSGTLRLEVANDGGTTEHAIQAGDGPAGRANRAGGGLTGLAERAAHAGGTLTAEPSGQGGFLLAMEVPA
ncbi:sensor histidine kinase [Nonomuraea sp. LPB2021202275-12-8]|uniref:sensor histidine kinase n=1 Tax=Nonomuraea sp. LPB2021202275-12-8 TaxID=3120159 RepID=UPI00300C5105